MQRTICLLTAVFIFSFLCSGATGLSIESCQVPTRCYANKAMTVAVEIVNNESYSVFSYDYDIVLSFDGVELVRTQGEFLAPYARKTCKFTYTPGLDSPENIVFDLHIDAANTSFSDGESFKSAPVRIMRPLYPRPRDVQVIKSNGLTLYWSLPDESEMPPESSTVGFDDCSPMSKTDLDGFRSVDCDGLPTLFLEPDQPWHNFDNNGTPIGWMSFDPDYAGLVDDVWKPYRGSQCVASIQACKDGDINVASNDWLVSPQLNGEIQEVWFYARAASPEGVNESFDFMISNSADDVGRFVPLVENVSVNPADGWREFSYILPEGTKYFAIVHRTVGGVALLVDDITYTRLGAQPPYMLLRNYKVYRDGVLVTSSPVSCQRFVDDGIDFERDYTYRVTAVWNLGESDYSDSVSVEGVSAVTQVADDGARVTAHPGAIRIVGSQKLPVSVWSASGLCVYSSQLNDGFIQLEVAPGIYIVKAGAKATRLLVNE